MSEHDLIVQLKNDDRHAFDIIYGMYAGKLMSYCLSYIRIIEDAEEIIQDIFTSLWKNRHSIQNTETLYPFLSAALRNSILYYFRRKLNSPVYEEFISLRDETHPIDDRANIEYEEFRRIIISEINELPRSQREAIILSKFKGLSNKEIADKLGISIQTVKNALSVGLKNLRKRLSRYPEIFPITAILIYSSDMQSFIQ
ncbi:MAG: RNA polymerase sigma-70 factor [Muribaculaceae bacterium]|nr:RNA polymerase sigma-70 factor [Muribaculaceae bacterium]